MIARVGIASEIHSRCDCTQIYQNFRHESLNRQIPMVCKRSHYSGITMYSFETLIAYSCLLWETNSRSSSTYLSTWLAAEQCNAWYAFTDAPYSSTKRLTPWQGVWFFKMFQCPNCWCCAVVWLAWNLHEHHPQLNFHPYCQWKSRILIVYLVLLRAIIIMLSSFKCTIWSSI